MNNHHGYLIGRNTRKYYVQRRRRREEREEEEMGLCRDFILAAHRPMLHGIASVANKQFEQFKPKIKPVCKPPPLSQKRPYL
jgi:hypothetical protein